MKRNIYNYVRVALRPSILLLLLQLVFRNHISAQFIDPLPEDTAKFGVNVQRTMKLLATSTKDKKNTVKVLVYGQSISKQEWWLNVRTELKRQFPNANLIMENRSLGGFASNLLVKTVESDVMAFYPDLVLFHVYNSDVNAYKAILDSIRSRTGAEIALQNNHYTGGDEYDYDSYGVEPPIAADLKLEMMDIRTPWIKYLKDNKYQYDRLLVDGVHLNDTGSFLLAKLIERHLAYKPKFTTDPYGLLTTYEIGKDISFVNNKLTLPFNGNKVDLIAANATGAAAKAEVMIDGKKPSTFPGAYYFSRPNDSTSVARYYERDPQNTEIRKDWPWMTGGILKVTPFTTTIEDWDITVTNYNYDGTNATFDFALKGSVTGDDGSGKVTLKNGSWSTSARGFVSTSRKVRFSHNDWWLPQAIEGDFPYKGTKDDPKITFPFHIRWSVIPKFTDLYEAPVIKDPTLEYPTTAIQGITNGPHVLELTSVGNGTVPLKSIKVYRPYSHRISSPTSTFASMAEETITVYPNPASNFIKVNLPVTTENISIDVLNVLGTSVSRFAKNDAGTSLTLDLSDFTTGMYLLNIKIGNDVISRKFNVAKN
ncbi:MAG TPA: T9SS type A sorting domain-containing protein [Cytophagaceae bacterium]|jgi:hypothetical protein